MLVPAGDRLMFHALINGDFPAYQYKTARDADDDTKAGDFHEHGKRYLRLATAAIDLELPAAVVAPLLAEHAYAAQLELGLEAPNGMEKLKTLFAFQAAVEPKATRAFAEQLAAAPMPKTYAQLAAPHLHDLAAALARSILGDDKGAAAKLAAAAKRGPLPGGGKSGAKWFAALLAVARASLVGKPSAAPLPAAADAARAYLGKSALEEMIFEPWLAAAALAFVARARDRGLAVTGDGPDPALPFAVLRLPRKRLPSHPWTTWPRPPAALVRQVNATIRVERKRAGYA